MNVRHLFLCGVAAFAPALAAAQSAQTAKTVNLRAGPARDYPLVVRLGPGTPLAVQGCTDGFGWCDVVAPDGTRGWVYAGNIVTAYQNSNVPVLGYGASIGFPIVAFSIGSYWGSYYRDRSRWEQRPPPQRPGFAGPPPGAGRPGFAGRPPPDARVQEAGRPVQLGRPGDGAGRPGFDRGEGRAGRPGAPGPGPGGGRGPGGEGERGESRPEGDRGGRPGR